MISRKMTDAFRFHCLAAAVAAVPAGGFAIHEARAQQSFTSAELAADALAAAARGGDLKRILAVLVPG